jgi:hypothetical protein
MREIRGKPGESHGSQEEKHTEGDVLNSETLAGLRRCELKMFIAFNH